MMNMKAMHKDFWMEIRKSKARFISIFMIVALGVAFFSGIQASSPDMRFSGDAYYDETNLMDIKVVGTLGLTEDDVAAIKQVDGVENAEGAYGTDVMCGEGEKQKVLHVEAVDQTMNRISVTDGKAPEKSGEIFLDCIFAESNGYKVGDQITLKEGGDSELLKKTDYTVVGLGESPLYISYNRGNSTLGSGEVNGFAYVLPEDFDQEVYTQIYVQAHGAQDLISYTDAYDSLIERVQERVEGIEAERCQVRYDEIVEEANDKLADARQELEDGKKEANEKLADARQELEDGKKKLKDGKKEYKDGKKKLADAKKELEDGKARLADAKKELEDGRSQLASAKEQIASGREQIASAKEQLNAGWAEVSENQAKLDDGKAQLEDGKNQLSAGEKKIADAKTQLTQSQQELDNGKAQIQSGREQIAATRQDLNAKKESCNQGLAQIEQQEAQLSEGEAQLEGARSQLAALQAQYEEAAASGVYSEEELAALAAQVSAYQEQVDSQAAQLEASRNQIAAARSELESGLSQVESGLAQLDAKEAELNQQEAVFPDAQAKIDAGWKEVKAQEKKLEPARKEIQEKEAQLESAQEQIDAAKAKLNSSQAQLEEKEAELASGEAQIRENEGKLASGEKEIADNEQKLRDGEKEISENEQKLKDSRKDIKKAEKDLEEGKKEYEDGKKDAEREIADGEKKIQDAQDEIDDISMPEWMVTDRNDLPEYSDYGDNADRMRSIGQVFPVIFFLVAALVSLTTMTRMVEEQRTQIGTMKALGYGKYAIASKYLLYAFLATVGGSILGILIGEKILPLVIINGYGIMYKGMMNNIQIRYEFKFAMIAAGAATVCTVGATIFSCYRALAETPASLMRPPAPKEGKRILLERIPLFWKHLNFTWKSTLRNLFRYKKRFFMTIFGISGSMALMLVGFGLRDSIMDIARRQYQELQHYTGTIIDDEDATDKERQELDEFLENNSQIERYTHVQFTKMSVPRNKSNISVYVYVPENLETFNKDVTLQDRKTKEKYKLTDAGTVISGPPAPKEGKRILLERIPLFWKHLNFTWKSTLRNLFRYKKRFFMTIFGISGSMALMLVGFGLRDSIMDIARRQYQELQHYTGTIIDDEDATDKERQELDEFLENNSQIERYTHVQFTKMSVPRNKSNISVYVYVPENLETFNKDVTLQDRKTKEKYKLTDAGTVISEKTATLTGLKVGDSMTITKDGKNYETKIAAVTENYMGHYIYMTGNVYEQTFGEKPNYSATVFTVKEEYKESESEVGNEILKYPAALSISYTSSLEAQLHRMLGALDTVIIVLIISAGMLAFVVLYNLNNVNITERQRELATLKVLGFYDTEVSAYVYRENVILTFIGVLAGAVFGIFLHRYIIRTVEVDAVMFGRNINPVSFLYCGLLTIGFSMIVNLFMHQKLKKIDMVESLKSVE